MTHTEAPANVHLAALFTADDLVITISDEGPGITSVDVDRVFDRFYRGDESRARSTGGSGLGLSITRSIIEAHGGTITAADGPDGGAIFTILLSRT